MAYNAATRTFDITADLRLQRGTNNALVSVLGYYEPGDHGGAKYYWDSSCSDPDDGGAVIRPTVGSGNGGWRLNFNGTLDVRFFGAPSDGISDATSFIQAAYDWLYNGQGGYLFFATGRYKITSSIVVKGKPSVGSSGDKTNMKQITFLGEGEGSRLVAQNVDWIITTPTDKYYEGFKCKSLTFYSPDRTSGAINITWMMRILFDDCFFLNLLNGIYSNGVTFIVRIINSRFDQILNYPIRLVNQVYDVVIFNNTIESSAGGIQVGDPNGVVDVAANTVRIIYNVIEGNAGNPAVITGSMLASEICGNYFEKNLGGDLSIGSATIYSKGVKIESNSFQPDPTQLADANYRTILLSRMQGCEVVNNFSTGGLVGEVRGGLDSTSAVFLQGNTTFQPTKNLTKNFTVSAARKLAMNRADYEIGITPEGLFHTDATDPLNIRTAYIYRGTANPETNNAIYGNRTWNRGDIVLRFQPGLGVSLGWVCELGGTPGTWREFGLTGLSFSSTGTPVGLFARPVSSTYQRTDGSTSVGSFYIKEAGGETTAGWRRVQGINSGPTAGRPITTGLDIGYIYFDTDVNSEIVWNGTSWIILANQAAAPLTPIRTAAGTTSVTSADGTVLVNNTATATIGLPTASTVTGRIFVIKKVSANAFTVVLTPQGAETIDGNTNLTIVSITDSVTIQSDGTGWRVLTNNVEGRFNVRTITATATLNTYDWGVLVNNTAAAVITLPTAASVTGRTYWIKKGLNNAFTVTITGAEQGVDVILSSQNDSILIQSNGANYNVISRQLALPSLNQVLSVGNTSTQSMSVGNFTSTGSLSLNQTTITSTTTLTDSQTSVWANNVGAITINIPTAVGRPGRVYIIKKISNNADAVTIDPAGSETIDGLTTVDLTTQYDFIVIQSNNANWFQISPAL